MAPRDEIDLCALVRYLAETPWERVKLRDLQRRATEVMARIDAAQPLRPHPRNCQCQACLPSPFAF